MKIKKTMYTIVDAEDGSYPNRDNARWVTSDFNIISSKLFGDLTSAKRCVAGLKRYGEYKIVEVKIEWEVKQ